MTEDEIIDGFELDDSKTITYCYKCLKKGACRVYTQGHCPKHLAK